MTRTEDIFLESGSIIMKTMYSEIVSLQRYLDHNDEIQEGNFSYQNIKFQVEGNTALHLFALDERSLRIILEYFEENKKEYLGAILMKNELGKTPIDITIENDSPKNTDLLFQYLSRIEQGSFSKQIFTRFPDLLQSGMKSFHDYLDT